MLWPKQTKQEVSDYQAQRHKTMMLNSARTRAKNKNLPFEITEDDFEIPEVCPYLKTPFVKGTMYGASLDRILPTLGYIPGNVEVISRKANVMKNNASVEELLEFAYTVLDRN